MEAQFDLSSCWDCGPDVVSVVMMALVFFFAPVGAFVMRKHIAEATGWWKLTGRALQAAAAVSLSFAAFLMLYVIMGLLE